MVLTNSAVHYPRADLGVFGMKHAFRSTAFAMILMGGFAYACISIAEPPVDGNPYRITAKTVRFVPMGMFVDDPHYALALVNLDSEQCFAVTPPGGMKIFTVRNYMVVDEPQIPGAIRTALIDLYPECRIVRLADAN